MQPQSGLLFFLTRKTRGKKRFYQKNPRMFSQSSDFLMRRKRLGSKQRKNTANCELHHEFSR
jgi:hypothetical protein